MTANHDDQRPRWDEDDAQGLVGSTVIIGITRLLADGPVQEQMHGRISAAEEGRGVAIELTGTRSGEVYWLPPDLRNFSSAAPGEYRLRSTGEVVVNPDYISTWTIEPPLG